MECSSPEVDSRDSRIATITWGSALVASSSKTKNINYGHCNLAFSVERADHDPSRDPIRRWDTPIYGAHRFHLCCGPTSLLDLSRSQWISVSRSASQPVSQARMYAVTDCCCWNCPRGWESQNFIIILIRF